MQHGAEAALTMVAVASALLQLNEIPSFIHILAVSGLVVGLVLYVICNSPLGEHTQAPRLAAGVRVKVLREFVSDGLARRDLWEGLRGRVVRIDCNGDAEIDFDGINPTHWVCKEKLDRLEVDSEAAASPPVPPSPKPVAQGASDTDTESTCSPRTGRISDSDDGSDSSRRWPVAPRAPGGPSGPENDEDADPARVESGAAARNSLGRSVYRTGSKERCAGWHVVGAGVAHALRGFSSATDSEDERPPRRRSAFVDARPVPSLGIPELSTILLRRQQRAVALAGGLDAERWRSVGGRLSAALRL